MPELPEVETMRRGVLPIVGGTVTDVVRPPCRCRPIELRPRLDVLRRRVVGRTITGVDRVGKRVVVVLDGGQRWIFEPRMTGLVLLADPPDDEHLRLVVTLRGAKPRRFSFWDRRGLGSARLLTPAEFAIELGPDKLGPDALTISAAELRGRLGQSRRAVKVALLDQRAVAGIGNLYAAEILHVGRVDPRRSCRSLTANDWRRLHAATREVLAEAIRYEGSTLSDGTYRNALNRAGSYQNQHRVYDRAGETCPTCSTAAIERIVQAQRATFFCPTCQGKSRRKPMLSPRKRRVSPR